jgi:hypothetical protein
MIWCLISRPHQPHWTLHVRTPGDDIILQICYLHMNICIHRSNPSRQTGRRTRPSTTTINHMKIMAILLSHAKIHNQKIIHPQPTVLQLIVFSTENDFRQKRRHARVPDRHLLSKSHLLICSTPHHTDKRSCARSPLRWQIFLVTGGPAWPALQLACTCSACIHSAAYRGGTTGTLRSVSAGQKVRRCGYADGCVVESVRWCSEVHVPTLLALLFAVYACMRVCVYAGTGKPCFDMDLQ